MNNNFDKLRFNVANYYSEKLAEHGETPKGVDWNGENSQLLRFAQLSKIIEKTSNFSVNDLGCGYGALLPYLNERYTDFNYRGNDISTDMVRSANNLYAQFTHASFSNGSEPDMIADYGIASGIFSVRLDHTEDAWKEYIEETLDILNKSSRLGFAFNCLTAYSDKEKMRDYLHYADPCALFDFCKRHYSLNVALLHDYDLYEFTILVRKIS